MGADQGRLTMDLGIKGRTALVCAASKGLGEGCAMALAREGVNVTITARTQSDLDRAAAEIRREGAWCTDRLAGAEELSGVGERPLSCLLDADRAVQAQPGPPPPHPATAAQGHELAGLRRQLTAARQPDGVVHR